MSIIGKRLSEITWLDRARISNLQESIVDTLLPVYPQLIVSNLHGDYGMDLSSSFVPDIYGAWDFLRPDWSGGIGIGLNNPSYGFNALNHIHLDLLERRAVWIETGLRNGILKLVLSDDREEIADVRKTPIRTLHVQMVPGSFAKYLALLKKAAGGRSDPARPQTPGSGIPIEFVAIGAVSGAILPYMGQKKDRPDWMASGAVTIPVGISLGIIAGWLYRKLQ